MFYLIYQTTNIINGKIYIGKHKTKNIDDGYTGSGKLLKRAIAKYGRANFKTIILFNCENEEEMNAKEREIVNQTFISSENVYNLCEGGQGGFSYINRIRAESNYDYSSQIKHLKSQKHIESSHRKRLELSPTYYSDICVESNKRMSDNFKDETFRQSYIENHKKSLPQNHQCGETNSQYGKKFKFINDGHKNLKVEIDKLDDYLAKGYHLGRIKMASPVGIEPTLSD